MAAFALFADLEPLLDGDVDVKRAVGLLSQASDAVRGEVGQRLDYTAADVATVAFRDGLLLLPEVPVLAVSSVVVDGVAVPAEWGPAGVVTVPGRRLSGVATVTYDHGHRTVPPAVKRVTLQVAKRAYENPGQLVQESGPAYSVSYGQQNTGALGLLEEERRALDPFRP